MPIAALGDGVDGPDIFALPLHQDLLAELANLPHRDGEVFRRPDGKPYGRPRGDYDLSAGSKIGTAFQVCLGEGRGRRFGGDGGQVRRAIAWVYKKAATFDGDPDRLYIGGHSSGGHLCGVALVTDWEKDFGVSLLILDLCNMLQSGRTACAARRMRLNEID